MRESKSQIGRTRAVLALLFSALVIGGGITILRQSSRLAAYERQHRADADTIAQLRAVVRQGAAHAASPAPAPPEIRPAAPARPPGNSDEEIALREAALAQANRDLADARTSIANLQAQLQSAEQEKQQALAASDDLQKRDRDWSNQLDSLRQQLDSAHAQSQAFQERAAALEADNARMKQEAGTGSTRIATRSKDLAALQDIVRQRDGYLNGILRRYREITDQFRAMAGALDSSHGAESAPLGGITLSRIQNAVSLAEDDMRRVNELNTQARQIEARLAR